MSGAGDGEAKGAPGGELAGRVVELLRRRDETLAVAESCTGGLLGAALTSVPGSSDVFWGGVIAYADGAKRRLLGVEGDVLARDGAVSEEAALAMARGVRERSGADWSLSVTGIAGPGGGTPEKPVGTVWLGLAGPGEAGRGEARSRLLELSGTRAEIRRATVRRALEMLAERAAGPGP